MSQFPVPILFIIFNRPDNAQEVFNRIREIKPEYLYVHADGARENNESDAELCPKCREIIKQVDWDCEVKTLFRDTNMGLKYGVSSAISWFFENVEEGIILEDDCLPDKSFLYFCQEMLEHYRNDMRIMHITGNNFQEGLTRGDGSYYFSRLPHIWGWASWRRAWRLYDVEFVQFEQFIKNNLIKNIFEQKDAHKYWNRLFTLVKNGKLNTWDYQWAYAVFLNNGLCIIPNENLVANIGFGSDSTNCSTINSPLANMPCRKITEIIHPTFMIPDEEADYYVFKKVFKRTFIDRLKSKIKKLFPFNLAKTGSYNINHK